MTTYLSTSRPYAAGSRLARGAAVLGAALLLAGCSTPGEDEEASPSAAESASSEGHGDHEQDEHGDQDDHGAMDHPADGGPVPEGMAEAADPDYPVGSEVTLTADHMEGMQGAPATIVGAYETYTYSVDYSPVDGSEPQRDHRWVVQEEIEDAGDQRLADGADAVLLAEHMDGMRGAEATIASSTDETVYVVDVDADGMTMTNHKWVVESEIDAAD